MADTNLTRRSMLGAMATAPVVAAAVAIPGVALAVEHSDFETALRKYYAARDAMLQESNYGAARAADDLYERRIKPLIEKYGRDRRKVTGEDAERWDAYYDEAIAAEKRFEEQFIRPQSKAFQALVATPAPTLAAVLLKIELGQDEVDHEDIIAFVKADLRRLGSN